ncbi:MAG TPA: hypothetical protein PLD20_17465 [Blastocatellia bacterium]|nr:hypothetical protein [Blastocatellia bacterium]HMZ19729.1 hypothetical protein [Blastocatellia bacterium]HNG33131.1 hypothetical protein [Blastocatellia bacterium]
MTETNAAGDGIDLPFPAAFVSGGFVTFVISYAGALQDVYDRGGSPDENKAMSGQAQKQ